MDTVIALYNRYESARDAFQSLLDASLPQAEVSLLASDPSYRRGGPADTSLPVETAAVMIPGLGPVRAGGPLIARLLQAPGGATAPGIVSVLADKGIAESAANIFVEGVRRGGAVVVASVPEAASQEAAAVLNQHRPVQVDKMAENWTDLDSTVPSLEAASASFPRVASLPPERTAVASNAPARSSGSAMIYTLPSNGRAATYDYVMPRVSLADAILAQDNAPFSEWEVSVDEQVVEPVVHTRVRVVEEVSVYKTVETENRRVQATARRQKVDVERTGETKVSETRTV